MVKVDNPIKIVGIHLLNYPQNRKFKVTTKLSYDKMKLLGKKDANKTLKIELFQTDISVTANYFWLRKIIKLW